MPSSVPFSMQPRQNKNERVGMLNPCLYLTSKLSAFNTGNNNPTTGCYRQSNEDLQVSQIIKGVSRGGRVATNHGLRQKAAVKLENKLTFVTPLHGSLILPRIELHGVSQSHLVQIVAETPVQQTAGRSTSSRGQRKSGTNQ